MTRTVGTAVVARTAGAAVVATTAWVAVVVNRIYPPYASSGFVARKKLYVHCRTIVLAVSYDLHGLWARPAPGQVHNIIRPVPRELHVWICFGWVCWTLNIEFRLFV